MVHLLTKRYGLVLAGLLIMVLALAAPVSAVVITIDNSTPTAIKSAVASANTGDIIILKPGTYFENSITIGSKSLTIKANTTAGGNAGNTIIDGMSTAGGIFTVTGTSTLTIDNLTLQNGQAANGGSGSLKPGKNGGAISSTGRVTVTSSIFTNCSAGAGGTGTTAISNSGGNGGAIYTLSAVTVTSSTFVNCSAGAGGTGSLGLHLGGSGGAISSPGAVTVTSSTINGCSAGKGGNKGSGGSGGAIATIGAVTVTSSTITGCSAGAAGNSGLSGLGSAISGVGGNIHFNRIVGNSLVGNVVSVPVGDARNNWWGTDADPSSFLALTGGFYKPWLVLGGTATPSSITRVQTSVIRMNLTYNSNGIDTSGGGIFVPDGIPVAYAMTSSTGGNVLPTAGNTSSGWNTTVFSPPPVVGPVTINVTLDDQNVTVPITVIWGPATHFEVSAPHHVTAGSSFPFTVTALEAGDFIAGGYTGTVHFTSSDPDPETALPADTTLTAGKGSFSAMLKTLGIWAIIATDTVTPAITGNSGPIHVAGPGFYTGPDVSDGSDAPSVTTLPTNSPPATFLPMTVTVNIGGNGATGTATVTGTNLAGVVVTGTVQDGPGSNQTAPPGIVYQYINLVPARYTSITNTVITFTVPQSWLDENHIAPESIVLYHETADGWVALPTTVLYTKDGFVFFSAQSTGFSLFAIAGTPAGTGPVTVTQAPGILSSAVQEPAPVKAAATKAPVTTQTTAPPATTARPAAPAPILNVILVIAAIGILAGGGFIVRRWWVRRQNPALFREYD